MFKKIKGITGVMWSSDKHRGADARYIVGLDIGTEYVKVLIARINSGQLEVLGVGKSHQELGDMQAGAIADIAAVVQNCNNALSEAESQAGFSVRTAVMGIAGELVKGQTDQIKFRRTNPAKALDEAELERMIGIVQSRAEQRAQKQLTQELGGKQIDIRLINSALVGIQIDSYPITNPIGFQGKEVSIELYTAFAPMIHIGALERVARDLDLDLVAVAAEPFAVARAMIGNNQTAETSAILMDIGGGTTDIAILQDGGIQGTKMFGIGGRAFTRSVERNLNISFIQAEELKLALGSHKIPTHKQDLIANALQITLDVWLNGVRLALVEFDNLDNLPTNILLCGGGASLEKLRSRLAQSDWSAKLAFSNQPQVSLIDPADVVGVTDRTNSIDDHTYITAMGLLRVGLDTLEQEKSAPAHKVRQKIDRMLRT